MHTITALYDHLYFVNRLYACKDLKNIEQQILNAKNLHIYYREPLHAR